MLTAVEPAAWSARDFWKRYNNSPSEDLPSPPPNRSVQRRPAQLPGAVGRRPVSDTSPLPVTAFLDGIQASRTIYRSYRPIVFQQATAAAIGAPAVGQRRPWRVGLSEFAAIASPVDTPRLRDCGLPERLIVEVDDGAPEALAAQAKERLGEVRARLERELCARVLEERPGGYVVVDGSLSGHVVDERVCGVVKTCSSRYLEDERVLYDLRVGERTDAIRVRLHDGRQVASCYLRLRSAWPRHPWAYGLVRVEAYDAELLDPLCVKVLRCRQPSGSPDPRADRHIEPIRLCEEVGRATVPPWFDLV
jgi:hypothetical protein